MEVQTRVEKYATAMLVKTKAQAEQYKELPHIKCMIYNVNNRQDKENIRKSQRYR